MFSSSPPFSPDSVNIMISVTVQTQDETRLPSEWSADVEAFLHSFSLANAKVGLVYLCRASIIYLNVGGNNVTTALIKTDCNPPQSQKRATDHAASV